MIPLYQMWYISNSKSIEINTILMVLDARCVHIGATTILVACLERKQKTTPDL